jgi:Transcription-silencing protein, cryptic loci regulator Clr2
MAFRLTEGPSYVLKDWPQHYAMYDHHKGPKDSPRHDIYLFGEILRCSRFCVMG